MTPNELGQVAEANGLAAGEPFPREVNHSLGDGNTTCLFHRQHTWSEKFYAPLMPLCTICSGRVDPRLDAHHLCVERQKRGLDTPQLDSFPACGCSKCSTKGN